MTENVNDDKYIAVYRCVDEKFYGKYDIRLSESLLDIEKMSFAARFGEHSSKAGIEYGEYFFLNYRPAREHPGELIFKSIVDSSLASLARQVTAAIVLDKAKQKPVLVTVGGKPLQVKA